MIKNHLKQLFTVNLGYSPTSGQEAVINLFCDFIPDERERQVLLLKGYAGTGKTTVIAALVKVLTELNINVVLMAPTGRAAKVLSQYSETEASTIHKAIYRQKSTKDAMSKFVLGKNFHSNTFFVVDEASMISDQSSENALFGSGNLLADTIQFVFNDKRCKLILTGDVAQLPPVGQELSNAMSAQVLERYGLHVHECELKEVVRQSLESGILMNATGIRNLISDRKVTFPKIKLTKKKDITVIKGNEVIDYLQTYYDKAGMDQTMVICRSNKLANRYNNVIRSKILFREEEISSGDYLMVVKNNYHWLAEEGVDFIANGDIVRVRRVRKYEELYGYRYATLDLVLPDYGDLEFSAKVNLDSLHLESASLSSEDNLKLYNSISEDYGSYKTKKAIGEKVREDPYFNALQVKYAYAVTCHKAQGGQWPVIFIDQSYFTKEMLNIEYLRWLYTAFTRASQHVVLVNFHEDFL